MSADLDDVTNVNLARLRLWRRADESAGCRRREWKREETVGKVAAMAFALAVLVAAPARASSDDVTPKGAWLATELDAMDVETKWIAGVLGGGSNTSYSLKYSVV
jgi:hypothetical protein